MLTTWRWQEIDTSICDEKYFYYMTWQENFPSDVWNLAISAALVTVKLITCKIILYRDFFSPFIPQQGQVTCSLDAVQSPPLNPIANMGGQKMHWGDRFPTFPSPATLEYTVFLRLSLYLYGSIPLSPSDWILHVGFSPLSVTEKIIITLAIQNHSQFVGLLCSVRMYGRKVWKS